MTIKELSKEQFRELKEHILCDRVQNVSYGEFLAVDEIISDKDVEEEYGGVEFTSEDFFCTCAG